MEATDPGKRKGFIQSLHFEATHKNVSFADKETVRAFAAVASRFGFKLNASRLESRVLVDVPIALLPAQNVPAAAQKQPRKIKQAQTIEILLSDIALPDEIYAAIANGGQFPGKEWADNQIKAKKWVFPNKVPTGYDLRFLKLYSTHFDYIKENFGEMLKYSPGKGQKLLDEAVSAMRAAVKAETGHGTERMTRFTQEYAEKFYWNFVNGSNGFIHHIAAANAVRDFYVQIKPADMSDVTLPANVLRAALGEGAFPGIELAETFVKQKAWVYPDGVDSGHDKRFWKLYAAHIIHLQDKYGDVIGGFPADAELFLMKAVESMWTAVRKKCTYKEEYNKFLLDAADRLYDNLTKDGSSLHKIAVACAIRDQFANKPIDDALTDVLQDAKQEAAIESMMDQIRRIEVFTGGSYYDSAFRHIRMPGEGIFNAIERGVGRLLG